MTVAQRITREAAPAPEPRRGWVAIGVAVAVALGGAVWSVASGRMVVALALGLALGLALFHSRFGFTSAWRQLVAVGQGAALRAHMLMIAVATLLFAVVAGMGLSWTGTVELKAEPIGFGLFVGAFLFGLGMQIGGSCASGTLFSVGSGQSLILFTLVGFITGSVAAAATWSFWTVLLPTGPIVDLAAVFGRPTAVLLSLAAMGAVVAGTYAYARRRVPPPLTAAPSARGVSRVVRGTWPLWVGALALGVLNAGVLIVTGAPWGITSAFALWGSKIAEAFGADPASWTYWSSPANAATYARPVLQNATSVIDLGIMIGAMIAAALGGVLVWHRILPGRTVVAALLGGVLMGYGARISGGCNIGAYFSGVASLSLHGWLWGATAIIGTLAGLRARPWFGLTNPSPSDSSC